MRLLNLTYLIVVLLSCNQAWSVSIPPEEVFNAAGATDAAGFTVPWPSWYQHPNGATGEEVVKDAYGYRATVTLSSSHSLIMRYIPVSSFINQPFGTGVVLGKRLPNVKQLLTYAAGGGIWSNGTPSFSFLPDASILEPWSVTSSTGGLFTTLPSGATAPNSWAGFWMCEKEIDQTIWKDIMTSNPSYFAEDSAIVTAGTSKPVDSVSWNNVNTFLTKITTNHGSPVAARLPTRAEWTYACRAGTVLPYEMGSTPGSPDYIIRPIQTGSLWHPNMSTNSALMQVETRPYNNTYPKQESRLVQPIWFACPAKKGKARKPPKVTDLKSNFGDLGDNGNNINTIISLQETEVMQLINDSSYWTDIQTNPDRKNDFDGHTPITQATVFLGYTLVLHDYFAIGTAPAYGKPSVHYDKQHVRQFVTDMRGDHVGIPMRFRKTASGAFVVDPSVPHGSEYYLWQSTEQDSTSSKYNSIYLSNANIKSNNTYTRKSKRSYDDKTAFVEDIHGNYLVIDGVTYKAVLMTYLPIHDVYTHPDDPDHVNLTSASGFTPWPDPFDRDVNLYVRLNLNPGSSTPSYIYALCSRSRNASSSTLPLYDWPRCERYVIQSRNTLPTIRQTLPLSTNSDETICSSSAEIEKLLQYSTMLPYALRSNGGGGISIDPNAQAYIKDAANAIGNELKDKWGTFRGNIQTGDGKLSKITLETCTFFVNLYYHRDKHLWKTLNNYLTKDLVDMVDSDGDGLADHLPPDLASRFWNYTGSHASFTQLGFPGYEFGLQEITPNRWGLANMSGNVAEWVNPNSSSDWIPAAPSGQACHFVMGGSWRTPQWETRSSAAEFRRQGRGVQYPRLERMYEIEQLQIFKPESSSWAMDYAVDSSATSYDLISLKYKGQTISVGSSFGYDDVGFRFIVPHHP